MTQPEAVHPTERAMLATLDVDQPPEPTVVATGPDRTVRATFLRWFLLRTLAPRASGWARFTLQDAHVAGPLSLAGMRLRRTCAFVACRFDSTIDLTDARIVGFELVGGALFALRADRLTATGSLIVHRTPGQPADAAHSPLLVERDVRLSGAKIRGNADFRGCHLGTSLPATPDSVCFLADGAWVGGHLMLSDGVDARGEVRLDGVEVVRNLNLSASTFGNPGGFSISAAGAHVHGTLYICRHLGRGFAATGSVRLEGARIDGDFDATGGSFTASAVSAPGWVVRPGHRHDAEALTADGVVVGAEMRLKSGFAAHGAVRLIGARVGTDLVCSAGLFDFPGEDALQADGITVEGGTFLDAGARTTGLLRFVQANLKQGMFLDGTVFDRGGGFANRMPSQTASELGLDVCGVYLPEAVVGSVFYFRNVEHAGPPGRTVWLSLQNARADTVEDDGASWDSMDRVDLRGCVYQIITGLDGGTAWRLARIDREYAPSLVRARRSYAWATWWATLVGQPSQELRAARKRFVPQPYLQFAAVVRAAGFESAANGILVQLERNATVLGSYGAGQMLTRWLLDGVLRYGYARWRPVWLLCAWIAVSAFVFDDAAAQNRLVPTAANPVASAGGGVREVKFDPLIYATDTLVPLVDLGQKRNFGFREPSWLLVFNSFFGWIMTSFFAAGVSGLLRKG